MCDNNDDNGWDNYETGPFCRHFGGPTDCEITCVRCGHRCPQHGYDDGDRECFDCDCPAWVEPAEP